MQVDKIKHLIAGIIISVVVSLLTWIPVFGAVAGFLAGALKEGYDWIDNYRRAKKELPPRHNVDGMDFIFTVMGAVAGSVACMLFM